MHARLHGEVAPGGEVGLDLDALEAVPRGDVEVARHAVVLGRVARRHHDPTVGYAVPAERLVLQKLQHRGRERLGHAVDLVEEEDPFAPPRGLHRVVHRGDDLAHRVLGHVVFRVAVGPLRDERQAERALPRVVRHRVRHEPHAQLLRDLLHDGRLADAGRAQQEHGALPFGGKTIAAELVLREIRDHRVFDLLLRLLDVHGGILSGAVGSPSAAGSRVASGRAARRQVRRCRPRRPSWPMGARAGLRRRSPRPRRRTRRRSRACGPGRCPGRR